MRPALRSAAEADDCATKPRSTPPIRIASAAGEAVAGCDIEL
jgi:hypothetical protein